MPKKSGNSITHHEFRLLCRHTAVGERLMISRARFIPAALVFFTVASLQAQTPAPAIASQDLLDGLANPSRWLTCSGDDKEISASLSGERTRSNP